MFLFFTRQISVFRDIYDSISNYSYCSLDNEYSNLMNIIAVLIYFKVNSDKCQNNITTSMYVPVTGTGRLLSKRAADTGGPGTAPEQRARGVAVVQDVVVVVVAPLARVLPAPVRAGIGWLQAAADDGQPGARRRTRRAQWRPQAQEARERGGGGDDVGRTDAPAAPDAAH